VGDGPERRDYGLDIFFRKEALGIGDLGEEWVGYIVMAWLMSKKKSKGMYQ
jgi:hypothetical protein